MQTITVIRNVIEGLFVGIRIFISSLTPGMIILLVLCVLIIVFYRKFRGFMGEFWVRRKLNKLPKDEYFILNNIMLKNENNTSQIDHIVVSRYGIFVIEMKNFYGLITGKETDFKWRQYLGKKYYPFANPIHQNYGHIKALEELLKMNNNNFKSIICFSNQSKLKVNAKTPVVYLDLLSDTIKQYKEELIDNDPKEIVSIIRENNITEYTERKEHVNKIKRKLKSNKEKVENMICPRCGNKLTIRNGNRGSFIGCTNYPKCRYTKNIQ